jgi:hypothetical protein
MQVYLAGNTSTGGLGAHLVTELFLQKQGGPRLFSYHAVSNDVFYSRSIFEVYMGNRVDLFLDSGAYSAWTQGVPIDIQKYIEFIKEHQAMLGMYANLDVIGEGGKAPSRDTAEKTLQNQHIMEEAGLSPMPCFHFGEPMEYLTYYVENYEYMALGGLAALTTDKIRPFLDNCFGNYICGQDGMPRIKVHGFAVTSHKLMMCYPWYSVDSTSWIMTSRMGGIFVPRTRGGKWIYDENSWKIAISNRSPGTKEAGKHFYTLNAMEREIILHYITEKGYALGKSRFHKVAQDHELADNEKWAEKRPKDKTVKRLMETIEEVGLCNTYQLRDELNAIYFMDLQEFLPPWPWAFKPESGGGFLI